MLRHDYEYLDDVNCLNVGEWRDVVEVCAGAGLTAGLRSDGTVLVAFNGDDGWGEWHVGAAAIAVCGDRSTRHDHYMREGYADEILMLDAQGHARFAQGEPFDWCDWDA